MNIQLYLSKGDTDFDGKVLTEDRFIIVNGGCCDLLGEHYTLEEAKQELKNLEEEEEEEKNDGWQEVDEGFYLNEDFKGFSISDNASAYLKPEVRENNFTVSKDEKELTTVNTLQDAKDFVRNL